MSSTDDIVAYIVVAWNNKTLLNECLASIFDQKVDLQKKIYLVDNNSQDGTVEYITEKYGDRVVLLAEQANHGFAKGNNIAIRLGLKDQKVKYFALVNTDATLAENWTQTLIDAARLHTKAACIQSITLDYFNHDVIDSTHIFISRYGQATQSSWRRPIAETVDTAPHKVFGCNAAAMLITRAFVDEQPFEDFFDETMFMYLEDVDVAARATVMGWDNIVVPGAKAFHMGSVSSSKKDPRFSLYMTFRNNLGLMIKNLPAPILFKIIMRIPKSDLASIRHLRRIGKGYAATAIVKGRFMSLLFVPKFIYKRFQLRPHRHILSSYLWRLMDKGF